jgi:hypothetical protein
MTPEWTESAGKHNISRSHAAHAIINATYSAELGPDERGGTLTLFIGPRHAQTDDELEILVRSFPGTNSDRIIFHVMQLGPRFRRYREENPRG